jgi:acetyl esterase/lipase
MRDSREILTDPPPPPADARLAYGPEPLQFGDLRVPSGEPPFPLALVLHGGYWQAHYNLIHTGHMCRALAEAGIATWNLEYRCVGAPGGEWPAARDDLELALAYLDRLPLPHDRVVLLGHSAGGQLALWAAAQGLVTHAVAQAGVSDLAEAARLRLSDGAALELVGGREELFAGASPAELLPLGVPQLLVHGEDDAIVPVSMSRSYHEAAVAAGDPAELVVLPGVGHFEHLDPSSSAWQAVLEWLP